MKSYLRIGFLLMALAVVFGAFGAHALKKVVPAENLVTWKTGVEYHFYHALGLIALCLIPAEYVAKARRLKVAAMLMIMGVLFFSGSLYLLTLIPAQEFTSIKVIGPVTPIGGTFFIIAWVVAATGITTK